MIVSQWVTCPFPSKNLPLLVLYFHHTQKKDLFLIILHDKPPNKNNQKVIIWFEGSFLYYFYRKACKLSVLYLSTLRSDYTSKPCYDFVSINSLIGNLFL